MPSLNDFIREHDIRMTVKRGAPANADFAESTGWTVTLWCGRRRMTIPFYMGPGLHGAPPRIDQVLDRLASDVAGVANAMALADWCAEYGYDADSRKDERLYQACEKLWRRLRWLIGDEAAETLLFDIE